MSFMKAVTAECIMEFFEMHDKFDRPANIEPPAEPQERLSWTKVKFQQMVKEHVGFFAHRKGNI